MDAWVLRLRDAYDAGYYRTEASQDTQSVFPWQNQTCRDCPFWRQSVCTVHMEYRAAAAHTCMYFDPWNREAGQLIVQKRQWHGIRRWWEWFNDRGAMR